MSLAKTNSTVLPGTILSEYPIPSYRVAEQHFEGALLTSAAKTASRLPPGIGQPIVDAAMEKIAAGKLAWGSHGFYVRVISGTYTPFLLWLSMLPANPEASLEEATKLVTRDNHGELIQSLMDLMGYQLPNDKAAEAKKTAAQQTTESTSQTSETQPPVKSPSDSTGTA